MRKRMSLGALVAAMIVAGTVEAQDTRTYRLTANITKSQEDFATQAFQSFAERVAAYSDGKVIVDVHYGAELGFRAADGLLILANRAVDISETVGAFDGAVIPDIMITTLPFFITSFDEFEFFDRMLRPHLDKLFAEHNARCLLSYSLTAQHFWNKKAVNTIDDLAGVKMRTYDRATTDMLTALGAAPLRIDFTELYTSLQQGTVDGMVTSIASVLSLKAYEVVDHANLTAFSTGGINCLAINTEAWAELPPPHQLAMLQAARETEDELRIRVPEIEREGLGILREHGMIINPVPVETIMRMRELTEGIRAEFLQSIASPELREIVDRYEYIRGLK